MGALRVVLLAHSARIDFAETLITAAMRDFVIPYKALYKTIRGCLIKLLMKPYKKGLYSPYATSYQAL